MQIFIYFDTFKCLQFEKQTYVELPGFFYKLPELLLKFRNQVLITKCCKTSVVFQFSGKPYSSGGLFEKHPFVFYLGYGSSCVELPGASSATSCLPPRVGDVLALPRARHDPILTLPNSPSLSHAKRKRDQTLVPLPSSISAAPAIPKPGRHAPKLCLATTSLLVEGIDAALPQSTATSPSA
jgi:hypothetical protein